MISSPEVRSLDRARLLMQASIAIALLLIANLAIARLAQSSVPRQRLSSIEQARGVTDLFLGNSVVDAGISVRDFEQTLPGTRALNLGLGATAVVEHYLFLLASDSLDTRRVYYGFVDMQLTDSASADIGSLSGNRAIAYYLFPDTARHYYAGDDRILGAKMALASHIPMVVDRAAVWGRVEQFRRQLAGFGVTAPESNRFGRSEDFAQLAPSDPAAFRAKLANAVGTRALLNPAVQSIAAVAKRSGASTYWIAMPMPSRHRTRLYESAEWQAYLRRTESLLAAEGGQMIDATDWIADSGFDDPVHLSATGAAEFTRRLATRVRPGNDRMEN